MGRKKHKKKIYTKPKRNKHKHKKVKLAVLNFYYVDDAGKIQRLRRECRNCGVGNFMADHLDRICCGKCGLTYKKREWDWRKFDILNSIRAQGLGQCCFAFAVCAQIESLFHLSTRGEIRIVLSPQDIYQNLINNKVEDDVGRTIPATLDWIVENGCILDEDCPYKETYDVENEGPRKVHLRIETVIPLRSEEAIIEAVKEEGPVAAQMYWIVKDMKHFKGDGICYYTPKDVSQLEEMHAVLIVGFGEHLERNGKLTKYWIIRNSHGSNWGDRGYGKVERSFVTGAWQIRGISFEDLNGRPY